MKNYLILVVLLFSLVFTVQAESNYEANGNTDYGIEQVIFDGFTSEQSENTVKLEWETILEVECRGFALEHSTDGIEFSDVSFVFGSGNESGSSYEYYHMNPVEGINYYRLREVSFNWDTSHSDIISLNVEFQEIKTFIFPNPTGGVINTKHISGDMQVFNVLGEKIITFKVTGIDQLDLSYLGKGVFFLKYTRKRKDITEVVIIQ